uniref:ARAD1B13464p n=1 Tax=Blastobotrys adeninivorans TaxID=409370 RepID=A0A060T6N3_BLAAD
MEKAVGSIQQTKRVDSDYGNGDCDLEKTVNGVETVDLHNDHGGTAVKHRTGHEMEKDKEEFPEGGYGWLVLAGSFLLLSTSFGYISTFGVYQKYYQQAFPDSDSSTISLIGSLLAGISYLGTFPCVYLKSKLGSRVTIAIGGALSVLSLMLTSLGHKVWHFYLTQGVLYGLGGGLCMISGLTIPPEWFKVRRAVAGGIVAAGSSLGGVVWPIAFQRLVDEVGFPWANRIMGFCMLPIFIFSALVTKSRLPASKRVIPNFGVLKDWKFSWFAFWYALVFFGYLPVMFYLPLYCQKLNLDQTVSQYAIVVLNGSSLIGRIVPGFIADKIGRVNVLAPSLIIAGILQFALWLPARGEVPIWLFAVLWGIASGCFVSMAPAAIGQLFGVQDNPSRITFIMISAVPAGLAASTISGSFLPIDGIGIEGFDKLICFSAAMMTGGGLGVVAFRCFFTRKLFQFI